MFSLNHTIRATHGYFICEPDTSPINNRGDSGHTNIIENRTNVHNSGRFYDNPVCVLARKIVRTEPVASMLMWYYVSNKNTVMVRRIIENGMTFDKRHEWMAYMSSSKRDIKTLNLLLKNEAPAGTLIKSFLQGRPEAIVLLAKKYNIELGKDHYSLVVTAASKGDVDSLKVLLSRGAPVFLEDSPGASPLQVAIQEGRLDAVKFLVQWGAPVNDGMETSAGRFLLFACKARQNSTEIVAYLLQQNIFSVKGDNYMVEANRRSVGVNRRAALSEAIKLDCNNHILCLLLIEVGESEALDLFKFKKDERFQPLLEVGVDKGIFKILESKDGDTYRDKLEAAIIEAHESLEYQRHSSLKYLCVFAIKDAIGNGPVPDVADTDYNARLIRAIDGLDYPKTLRDSFKQRNPHKPHKPVEPEPIVWFDCLTE